MSSERKEIVCLASPLIQSMEESNAWREKILERALKDGASIISPLDLNNSVIKNIPEQK